jgi:anaerobic magnesium-protoporphyrin IX monomethyl ester cyclase
VEKHKILLLNPPGDLRYIRDYYCSHVSKANYIWHPYDLFVQSGILSQDFEVTAFDANIDNHSFEQTSRKLSTLSFDTVLMLTGAVSWKNDLAFAQRYLQGKTLIASGDVTIANGRDLLDRFPFIEATLQDFTQPAINEYLRRRDASKGPLLDSSEPIPGFLYRNADGEYIDGPVYPAYGKFNHPVPRYELFPWKRYRVPHARKVPFASMMTDFGCPYHCSFCITGNFGYRLRDMDNVAEELDYIHSLGIEDIWFKDVVFGVNKRHYTELLDLLVKRPRPFRWATLSRVDIVTEDLLERMARAGCHTIQFGVESADEKILESIEKGISPERVKEVFVLCRKLGIRTLAHFIIGLPGETMSSAKRTIDFALDIDPDFASFNVASPRLGTALREEALEKGYIPNELTELDNSIKFPTMELGTLSKDDVWELRQEAIRRFYLRPSYLWRRLAGVRSFRELANSAYEGANLLRNAVRSGIDPADMVEV